MARIIPRVSQILQGTDFSLKIRCIALLISFYIVVYFVPSYAGLRPIFGNRLLLFVLVFDTLFLLG